MKHHYHRFCCCGFAAWECVVELLFVFCRILFGIFGCAHAHTKQLAKCDVRAACTQWEWERIAVLCRQLLDVEATISNIENSDAAADLHSHTCIHAERPREHTVIQTDTFSLSECMRANEKETYCDHALNQVPTAAIFTRSLSLYLYLSGWMCVSV